MSGGITGHSGATAQEVALMLTDIVRNFEKKFEEQNDVLREISNILLLMNDRDVNREPLYEGLDKLRKWYVPNEKE